MSAIIWSDRLVVLTRGDYALRVLVRVLLGLILNITTIGVLWAEPDQKARKEKSEDAAFAKRLKALLNKPGLLVTVQLGKERGKASPAPVAPSGITLASKTRGGIYVPPVISPEDMMHVIHKHMPDIKRCYRKQLAQDPEWADHLILDLAIRRTGRVSEVSVAPGRVRRDVIGTCLIRTVPRWRFPEFTGETDDGITQEVVTASFPFSFAAPSAR